MDITRFIVFFSILTLILSIIEFYTLFNWRKFVNKNKINILWYSIPKYLSIILLLISSISMFSSIFFSLNEKFRYISMMLIAIWVLPKLAIVPILMIKDVSNLFISLVNKFSNKKEKNIDLEKRKFVEVSSWSLATIPFFMVSKGLFSTTYDFTVRRAEVILQNLPKELDGLKIVQLSDLHLGSLYDYRPFQEVVRITNSLKADIIVITGDFVNNSPKELKENYSDLSKLNSEIGMYSCLGNHDHYMSEFDHRTLIKAINDTGNKLLINNSEKLIINNSILNIVGVDNVGMRQKFGDFKLAFDGIEEEETSILLCHDPTNWDLNIRNNFPADLTLSGHTHGGQVAWEFNGIEFKPAKFVYRQSEGLYKNGDNQLYVNRGIGTVGPPLRIGVKPEITELILKV